MPEGDTVRQLADALGGWVTGRVLSRAEVRSAPDLDLVGRRIEGFRARGKHLFLDLDGDLSIRSHLGMHGAWHRYAPGERWKKPARQAALVLAAGDHVLVLFHPKEVELVRRGSLRERDLERAFGHDLSDARPDLDAIVRRARERAPSAGDVAELLLDQRVASGIGNVYKSEVLFLERVNPFGPVADLVDADLLRLYTRAHQLLRANRDPGTRVTRIAEDGRGPLWVYGRAGEPCLRCSTPVRYRRRDAADRSTYWCPACQPESGGLGA